MLIDFRQQPTKCGLYGSALPLIQSQEQRESVGKGGCGQNLGLIMQQNQDVVYTRSDSAHREIA